MVSLRCYNRTLFWKTNVADRQHWQDDLNKLTEWSEKCEMLFNFGKYKCLHTGHFISALIIKPKSFSFTVAISTVSPAHCIVYIFIPMSCHIYFSPLLSHFPPPCLLSLSPTSPSCMSCFLSIFLQLFPSFFLTLHCSFQPLSLSSLSIPPVSLVILNSTLFTIPVSLAIHLQTPHALKSKPFLHGLCPRLSALRQRKIYLAVAVVTHHVSPCLTCCLQSGTWGLLEINLVGITSFNIRIIFINEYILLCFNFYTPPVSTIYNRLCSC